MASNTNRIYIYVLDNHSQFCVDESGNYIYIGVADEANSVQVRRIRGELFPCAVCKFRNSGSTPSTHIHGLQQRGKSYLPNIRSGKELGIGNLASGFSEILGDCHDFEKLT